jgi:predicted regulator of Ras-like GTPase activity (Roadblock/LC7/MglB family)
MELNRYDTVQINNKEYYVMDTIDHNNKKYVYMVDSKSDEVLLLRMEEEGFAGVSKEEALEVGIKFKEKYYPENN